MVYYKINIHLKEVFVKVVDIYLKASSLSKYPPIFNSTSMSIIIFIVKCCNDQLLGLKGVSKFFIKRWKSFWLKMRTTITAWVLISMSLFGLIVVDSTFQYPHAQPVLSSHCTAVILVGPIKLNCMLPDALLQKSLKLMEFCAWKQNINQSE